MIDPPSPPGVRDGLPVPPGWRVGRRTRRARARGGPRTAEAPGFGPGVLLPVRATPYRQTVLFGLLAAGFAALSVAAVVAGVRGRPGALAALLPFVPAAALFGFGAYAGVRSRRRVLAGLVLTPTHLVLGNYPTPVPVRWDEVTRVGSTSIRWGTRPFPDPVTNLVTVHGTDRTQLDALPGPARRLGERGLRRTGETGLASIAETVWAMDPVLAYHVLRLYQARPELRAELATGAGADRIRGGDVML